MVYIATRTGGAEVSSRFKKAYFALRRKGSIIVVNTGDPRLDERAEITQSGRQSDGDLRVTGGGQSTVRNGTCGQGDGLTAGI